MMHLIWFEPEENRFQADGDHRGEKVGSLGKAEWLDLSKRSLGRLGYFVVKAFQSALP